MDFLARLLTLNHSGCCTRNNKKRLK